MTTFNEYLENGSIMHNSVEYALLDQPQISNYGTDGEACYKALAVSQEQLNDADKFDPMFDAHVSVVWDVYPDWYQSNDSDESNACDWFTPSSVTLK